MKLQHIQADNFLRLNLFDVDMSDEAVVHLFAGRNESGKSSVQEAIRFALLGETVRVTKKGDYKLMIRDGAKSGRVGIRIDGIDIVRDIKSGKLTDEYSVAELPDSLNYLLDSQYFAKLNQDKRRSFLIGLTGTSVKSDDITRRMLAKGVEQKCIDMVIPMLRSGFTATHKEAQNRASEARAKWVGLTGNARYGSQIAANWTATPPEGADPDALEAEIDALQVEIDTITSNINNLNMDKGSINNQISVSKDKKPCACAHCGGLLRIETDRDPGTGKILQKSIPWSKDDVVDVGALQSKLIDKSNEIRKLNDRYTEISIDQQTKRAMYTLATSHKETTARARQYHEDVQMWEAAVEALAPDGIPAEILSDTLKPVNDRLRNTANITGWPQVTIDPTMEIVVDGRRYSLLSESARWRADVAIADAIAYLSGLKLLIVDRMDVLDMPGRAEFMRWIFDIRDEYDSILIFATLKSCPVLSGIKSHWIEAGEITPQEQEDAA